MLCRSCQNQDRCLPAQFALADPALATLLDQLQACQLQDRQPQDRQLQTFPVPASIESADPKPSFLHALWRKGQRWCRQVWQSLRRWGQSGRMGSA